LRQEELNPDNLPDVKDLPKNLGIFKVETDESYVKKHGDMAKSALKLMANEDKELEKRILLDKQTRAMEEFSR